jgi:hypothetical protein
MPLSCPPRSLRQSPWKTGEPPTDLPEPEASAPVQEASGESIESTDLDTLCEIVEQDPAALGGEANRVRQLCRARRHALATQGKNALPGAGGSGRGQGRSARPASGREAARQHREMLCRNGRGDAPACRPTGRMRPQPG